MAYAYFKVINSEALHTVEVSKAFEKLEVPNGVVTSALHVKVMHSGGFNVRMKNNGSHTSITDWQLLGPSSGFKSLSSGQSINSHYTVQGLLAHELLGHGLSRAMGSETSSTVDAIQMENLYYRTQGMNKYRTGSTHRGGELIQQDATNTAPGANVSANMRVLINSVSSGPLKTLFHIPARRDNTRIGQF